MMARARSFATQSVAVVGVLLIVYAALLLTRLGGEDVTVSWQQILNGIARGIIYGSLALSLVLIYRSTDVVNFAQGEMATFSVFISWSLLTQAGLPFWGAFVVTLAIAALLGAVVQRVVIAPVESAPLLTIVIVTLGLFTIFNQLSNFIWQAQPKSYPTPFKPFGIGGLHLHDPVRIFGGSIGLPYVGALAVMLVIMGLVALFFEYTKLGLASRAVAQNPVAARLVGVPVGWMLTLGWALAALVGAAGGMFVANIVNLDPNLMVGILLYAFAAAVLGGLDNPVGAVVGGFVIGIIQSLVLGSSFFKGIADPFAFIVIVLVLVVRPTGLLGRRAVKKV